MSYIRTWLAKRAGDYTQKEAHLLKGQRDSLAKELMKHATPAPSLDTPDAVTGPDVRLPRLPYNMYLFYLLRWQSTVLRTVCLKIKQEIFRETLKEGFEYVEKFKYKCENCGGEFQEEIEECEYCKSDLLRTPDRLQLKPWEELEGQANKADQTLLSLFQETEDDLNTVDDLYIVLVKDYLIGEGGEIYSKVREIMRGDPCRFRIVSDMSGRRGGKYWVCPVHRIKKHSEKREKCPDCGMMYQEVHYVETMAGGKEWINLYIAGEVIHSSKYEPSRLYGISPIFTLWVLGRTLLLMDAYAQNLYEKGRLKGIVAIPGHMEQVQKWWDDTQLKLQQDPHYLPVVGLETQEGRGQARMDFIKLIDSLKEMSYTEAKDMMRKQVAAMYGVSPIFQADVSTGGGLNNEGLQITVTDRAVDFGQAVYHTNIFPSICKALGITDWKIKLRPSRESDKMAEVQVFHQKAVTAKLMLDMGFDVKLRDDKFVFTGEASRQELPDYSEDYAMLGGDSPGESRLLPANRQGNKNCPPGKISTPERPRCHDMDEEKSLSPANYLTVKCKEKTFQQELKEASQPNYRLFWTLNKVKLTGDMNKADKIFFETEQGMRGSFLIKGYGYEKYKGENQAVVYFDKAFDPYSTTTARKGDNLSRVKKSGDMLAHYSCLKGKMNNAKIYPPDHLKIGKEFRGWIAKQEKGIRDKIRQFEDSCNKAGNKNNPRDPDYPYPYDEKSKSKGSAIQVFDMIRENDESGISGSGHVASGAIFPDGVTAIRWLTETGSTSTFDTFEDFKKVHVDSHPGNKTQLRMYSLSPADTSKMLKAIDSQAALAGSRDKLEDRFTRKLEKEYFKALNEKLTRLDDKSPESLSKEIEGIVAGMQKTIEQLAFAEVVRSYQLGKQSVKQSLTKAQAPAHVDFNTLPYSKADVQVIRAIYQENPFWDSFDGMSASLSKQLTDHIKESYEAPSSARFKATLRDVQRQYPDISLEQQQKIVYGRIGKFDLGRTLEKMKRTVNMEVYRLERIARSETTAVTAKGREKAYSEWDPEGGYLYDWAGPIDHVTSDQCKEIQKRVDKAGRGKGVPISTLKQIMKDVVEENNQTKKTNWAYRDWLPHANCRRVLRRTG